MGEVVGIFGMSGDGKTTSHIINPDGKCFYLGEKDPNKASEYKGMNPKEHFIINTDMKRLPIPGNMWSAANKNYVETDSLEDIREVIKYCAGNKDIKSLCLDTINLYLARKEYNDRRKLTFDQWRDVAIA